MKQSLRSWLWAVPLEQEVDEELVFHLEMHTRDLIANGMDAKTARELAASRLGDIKRLKRTCVDLGRKRDREMRLVQWLDEFRDDATFAVRQLSRSPGFTLVAALTLALGIGANSAIFALADATLLRPLPFAGPDRLVMLWEHSRTTDHNIVAPLEFAEWHDRNHTFESMAAATVGVGRAMTGPDGTGEQIPSQTVSVQFFDVFGVKPIAGRTFVAADDHQNPDAVVLGEGLWRSRFAADPAIVGRQIKLDGQPFTVIGVVPADFRVLAPSSAWTLLATTLMRSPVGVARYLRVIGRLKPGATLSAARADMTALAEAIARERPELYRDRGVTTEPLRDGLIGRELRLTSMLLLGVVGFVLLTCCANVANLLLARTTVRARELAVRSALGAGRRRIVRLLLTESLVLTAFAGLIGAGVGAAILKTAPSQVPPGLLPAGVTLAFDGRVLAFCVTAAFAVAVVFGVAPAWQATRFSIVQVITSGGRGITGGGARFRSLLAVGQVAAAVLLLCGAGLLLRTLNALAQVDPGYRAREVLTMVVSMPFASPGLSPSTTPYATPAARLRFYDAVEQEVRNLPGVRNVGWGSALPLDGWWVGMSFRVEGEQPQPEAMRHTARYQNVSASYFETLDLPILAGRAFTGRDTTEGLPVCIVNEVFVRRYLGGRRPIGTRIQVRGMSTGGAPLPLREIVGVVKQTPERPDETEPQPHIYVPLAQDSAWQASLVVQPAAGPASALAPSVRAAVARIDKERPVAQVRTLTGISREATSVARFRAVLVGTFAGLALTLAVVGVFGVLAYSVQQRVREFGIRIALGATTGNVLGLVFASAGGVIAGGAVIGLAAAALLGRSISSFLFGVQPLDMVTFASVALLLAVTAVLATAVPALRAARVDPVVALRNE